MRRLTRKLSEKRKLERDLFINLSGKLLEGVTVLDDMVFTTYKIDEEVISASLCDRGVLCNSEVPV